MRVCFVSTLTFVIARASHCFQTPTTHMVQTLRGPPCHHDSHLHGAGGASSHHCLLPRLAVPWQASQPRCSRSGRSASLSFSVLSRLSLCACTSVWLPPLMAAHFHCPHPRPDPYLLAVCPATALWGALSPLRVPLHWHPHRHCTIQEPARNWRVIFKALTLLDYVIKNGSEGVVEEVRWRLLAGCCIAFPVARACNVCRLYLLTYVCSVVLGGTHVRVRMVCVCGVRVV